MQRDKGEGAEPHLNQRYQLNGAEGSAHRIVTCNLGTAALHISREQAWPRLVRGAKPPPKARWQRAELDGKRHLTLLRDSGKTVVVNRGWSSSSARGKVETGTLAAAAAAAAARPIATRAIPAKHIICQSTLRTYSSRKP